MKKYINKRDLKLIGFSLIVGLLLGWLFFYSSGSSINTTKTEEKEVTNTVYTCSMHPQIKQNKPGLCPICAMDLVPLETGGSDEKHVNPNEIQMTESALALASVQTSIVKRGKPEKTIRLLGKVKADERKIAELTSRFGGRIEKLFINYTGQKVKKGQNLGTIYSPELITAQRELLEAMNYKEQNPSLYKSSRTKLRLWNLSEKQIDEIENRGEPITEFDIRASINGTVSKKHIAVGDYVKEGTALFELIDLSSVWVFFDAYESDLSWVNIGDKINFKLQSFPDKSYSAKISYIDPFINAKTRVAKLRVELNNAKGLLKPEMFVSGILESLVTTKRNELLIPKSSILWTGKRSVVYVKVPNRKVASFLFREVKLGIEAGNFYVVKQGLSEGEEIATNGVFKIDATAQLEGKQSMMNQSNSLKSNNHEKIHNHEHQNEKAKNLKHEKFRVSGNCEMCKATIEKSAKSLSGVHMAEWNIKTKKLHISFNEKETNLEKIHNTIANSGYDTDQKTAPKHAYDKLPPCCKYTRISKTSTKANLQNVEFKVSGNCGMCKNTIETAVKKLKGVNHANWNQETKIIQVSFNSDKIKLIEIHKAIAKVGYDTELEKADEEAYNSLHSCCKYTRE